MKNKVINMNLPQFEERNTLALRLLSHAKKIISFDFRYFNVAMEKLKFVPYTGSAEADGRNFYYEPSYILKLCRSLDSGSVARLFLHSLLHCIYRDMNSPSRDRELWDLACDIAVETAINSFKLRHISASPSAQQQLHYIERMKKDGLETFTQNKIYEWLRSGYMGQDEFAAMQKAFAADSHDSWYSTHIRIYLPESGSRGGGGSEYSGAKTVLVPKSTLANDRELLKAWERAADAIMSDIAHFSKDFGDTAGALTDSLRALRREKYDYTDFLRRFAAPAEAMQINEDEFDYSFYTFGMSFCPDIKMPFIEPLEYKDVKKIRDFVIAIDTSGSVFGRQVQYFLQKTYNILASSQSFHTRVNIHIVQCDSEISKIDTITTPTDFDEYIKGFTVCGGGGTDFRPVFEYVNKCLDDGVFQNLKGLIYFTDGFGRFPDYKPSYDSAFVFVQDDPDSIPAIPAWAIKHVLSREELGEEF